jgi:cell division protein FtsB
MLGDITLFNGAITGLKAAADIAIAFNNLRTMTEVQAKAIELQGVILNAQSSALAAQGEQFALVQRIRDLEKEIADVKAWHEEKQRYALAPSKDGFIVYALKRERSNTEPPHWICTNCYEDGRKSILNDRTMAPPKGAHQLVLECPRCKSHVDTGYSGGSVERKFAEDMP